MNISRREISYLLRDAIFVCIFLTVSSDEVLPDEQKLLRKLFNDQSYDNSVRPVFNSSDSVMVSFGFTLIQIMDMVNTILFFYCFSYFHYVFLNTSTSFNRIECAFEQMILRIFGWFLNLHTRLMKIDYISYYPTTYPVDDVVVLYKT